MAVQYRGPQPERNYSIRDFHHHGVTLTSFNIWRDHKTRKRHLTCTFKSNGLLGTIRTTCYGDSFALDVKWGGLHDERCLTTECKTIREAKSILFVWFRSKGFKVHGGAVRQLEFKNFQGTVSPFLL